jgi:hypothetical protein
MCLYLSAAQREEADDDQVRSLLCCDAGAPIAPAPAGAEQAARGEQMSRPAPNSSGAMVPLVDR